jgi:thioesterase domain-containing protein
LARHLGKDQPFYAIVPHGLDGERIPNTIEAMASERLRALLRFQPTGPYLIGGHCNGGIIAFEMARQMQKLGLRVDLLVVADATAMNVRFGRLRRLVGFWGFILRWDHDTQVDWFLRLRIFLRVLAESSQRGKRAQVIFVLKKILAGVIGKPRVEPLLHEGPRPVENVLAYGRALEGYVPGPYKGRMVFLRTDSLGPVSPSDPTAGWALVAEQVEVHCLPGNHLTCLTAHVGSLAEHLAACLRAAKSAAGGVGSPSERP